MSPRAHSVRPADPVAAVVFDLDDTLFLERDYAFSGFRAVARAFVDVLGDPQESAARMIELFDSPHRGRVFNQILREQGKEAEAPVVQRMVDLYRSHKPTISLVSDVDRALRRLRVRYKLGLITDGFSVSQWHKIDALGLRERVDQIIVTSDLTSAECSNRKYANEYSHYGKPCPLAFELMSERLGVQASHCVYVADNAAKDFAAPLVLGWRTVQIKRAGGVYSSAIPTGDPAESVIGTLDELDSILGD